MSRLIDDVYASREKFIDTVREPTVPLTESEKEMMRSAEFESGVDTDEEDIDDIIYG